MGFAVGKTAAHVAGFAIFILFTLAFRQSIAPQQIAAALFLLLFKVKEIMLLLFFQQWFKPFAQHLVGIGGNHKRLGINPMHQPF